jgi:HSP20 family protein
MLSRWTSFDDTFRTLDLLQRHMDDVFFDSVAPLARDAAAFPPLVLSERDDAFVLQAEVPGMKESDLSIVVENDEILFSGERKIEAPEGFRTLVRERLPARFSRKLLLSKRVDADKVSAELANGILTVTLPKAAEARPRPIPVKVSQ